ncbi:MAG: SMI1/KNR4 family protein [Cellvibrionaceae bacterium]
MQAVIDLLRQYNEDVPVPMDLPDDEDIVDVVEQILLPLPPAYREFLLTVGDVVCGHLEPATASDPNSHTYLPEMAAAAWSIGLPREYIPMCEAKGGYYCLDQEGVVLFWDGASLTDDSWDSIWIWARDVWLDF